MARRRHAVGDPQPVTAPVYELIGTDTRLPRAADPDLRTALLSQVQEIIPLVHITVASDAAVPEIFLSDRRCTIGGQLYLPRLLRFDNVQQTLGVSPDAASFIFGNADRVIAQLVNDCDMRMARLEFSLFHVATGIKIDLWAGDILRWGPTGGLEVTFEAGDPLSALTRYYPTREVSRTCWKPFKHPAVCPYVGGETTCGKSWENCKARGMQLYFGGILAKPQGVSIRENANKQRVTSYSLVSDSIYGRAVPEIYTARKLAVDCLVAAGREESDYYDALGVIGEGPLAGVSGGTLDGQPNHGPGGAGLRISTGGDGAENTDPFCLGHGSPQVWDGEERAAGTAFIEIRRTDSPGMQYAKVDTHAMKAYVTGGLGGWYWNTPNDRQWAAPMTNPVWIAVNMYLRYKGVHLSSAATQTALFDVDAAIVAAQVCATRVSPLITPQAPDPDGLETQYSFNGIIGEAKPLRDWLSEVLMTCLGFYTWSFGKLQLGVRNHSGSTEPYGAGNIIAGSLELVPIEPAFNWLTATFYDAEYEATNSVVFYDSDHVAKYGPMRSNMNLVGVSAKSQAARLLTIRLREELGGVDATEQRKARLVRFRTTVLGLTTAPGVVGSITHEDAPDGLIEFRCRAWRLNTDYSIDVEGQTTTNAMYDLAAGPRPDDVPADPPPADTGVEFVPGDVRPLGDAPFLVTQTPLPSGDIAFDFEYDPPDPLDSFAGVYAVFEGPEGSGTLQYSVDQPYQAISEANRHGTCRVVMPSPGVEEQWRVSLGSCTPTFRKVYAAHDSITATPTPNLLLDVAPGVAAEQPRIADVTQVTASVPEPVEVEDTVKARVVAHYVAPADLGTGDTKFSGVAAFVQTPSKITQLPDAFIFAGGAGQSVDIALYLTYPDAAEEWTIYLCPKSDKYTNPLTLRGEATPTPNVQVSMPTRDAALPPVPDVLAFRVGSYNQTAKEWTPVLRKETLKAKMLADWGCLLPGNTVNWSGVAIFIRVPDGTNIQATGIMGKSVFSQTADGLVFYDCIAIEGTDLPVIPESWTFIACSYDREGRPHHDAAGNPIGPTCVVQTLPKEDVLNFDTPGNVTGLAATANTLNGIERVIQATYTPPVGTPFQGVQFYLERPAGSSPRALQLIDGDGTAGQQSASLYEPAPADADVNCKLWAVPYSSTVAARLVTTGANQSASVTFTLPRYPLARQPANITVTASIGVDEGKNPIFWFSGGWDAITDPVFLSVAVDCVWSNGTVQPLGDAKGTPEMPFSPGPWPITTPDTCTLKFYSLNHLGVRNTVNPPTAGPFTIARNVSVAGKENCDVVAAFSASAIFDNGATPDGTEHWRLTWTVTAPADKKHAGYKIVLRPSSGADATIEPAGDQVAGPWWPIGAAETYTAYCVSRDAAGRYNTIGAATPKVTGIVVQAQTTGKVKANRLDPTTYDTTVLGPGIGGKLTVVAVDLSKPKLGSYDQTLFDPTSGMFRLKLSSQFKTTNNWLEISNLYVGNNTVSMPAGIFAYKYDGYQNILQGWMGYNGGVVGVWGKEIYGGGTGPADAPFYLNSAGVLGMTNPQITLSRVDPSSGSTNKVVITTSTYDALYTGALGVLVQRLNGNIAEPYTWHVSRGIVIHAASSYQLGALVGVYDATASAFHGEVTLYNNGGGAMTIWLNGKDGKGYFGKVTVATSGELDLAGNTIAVTSMTLVGYTPIKVAGATRYIAVYN